MNSPDFDSQDVGFPDGPRRRNGLYSALANTEPETLQGLPLAIRQMNESKYEAGYQDSQHPTGTGKPTIPLPRANEGAPPMREAGTRLIDRINDDGPSRNADAATSDLESRITGPQRLVDQVRQPADDRMSQMESEYQKYATPEQQPKMSLLRKIGLGAITALGGGAGVARGLENRNERFDKQQRTETAKGRVVAFADHRPEADGGTRAA